MSTRITLEFATAAVWQIGTGDWSRSLLPIFLRYGIAAIGPGRFGPFGDKTRATYYAYNPVEASKTQAFAEKVRIGDWIVARQGTSRALAVGQITGEYQHELALDDLDGWDLQHTRTVAWYLAEGYEEDVGFELNGFTRRAFARLNKPAVIEVLNAQTWLRRAAESSVPEAEKAISLASVLSGEAAEVNELEERIRHYINTDYHVAEAELTCHCVIPFLKLIGWRTEQIKLELGRVDISLFRDPVGYRRQTPDVIIEVKRFGNGLRHTGTQVRTYLEKIRDGNPKAQPLLIITNGMRYNIVDSVGDKAQVLGGFSLSRLRGAEAEHIEKLKA